MAVSNQWGDRSGSGQNRSDAPENRLLEYVRRIERHRDGRTALHVHLSRLQARHRRDHHIRVAATTFESVVRQYEGEIFVLTNHDIVFIGKNVSDSELEQAVIRLRYLFSEDPLIQFGGTDDRGEFCTWYHLTSDYHVLLETVSRLHQLTQTDNNVASQPDRPRPAMDAGQLAALENTLANADISSLVRNQDICAIAQNTERPVPLFHEVFVSMRDIADMLLPNVDVTGNRWLFMRLTETLDRRLLALLGRDAPTLNKAFSMNLNIATLLSPDFQKFDEKISTTLRGKLVIELQATDMFADIGAFLFAREYVHDRGYRLCLDGLTHYTYPLIDRERLAVDLIKIYWTGAMDPKDSPAAFEDLKRAAGRSGTARVILTRVDSARAIKVGQAAGITLFQGHTIDRLLRNAPRS